MDVQGKGDEKFFSKTKKEVFGDGPETASHRRMPLCKRIRYFKKVPLR